jgi:hypothetical protein
MKKIGTGLIALAIALATPISPALAGPAADALGTCLTDNTTGKERKDLARWVFVGMSAHPDMRSLSNVTDANREELDRLMASIVTRLLTESCRSEARLAMQTEGSASFQTAFGAVGQLAMKELMSNPAVNAAFFNYSKYLDTNKINSAFSSK